MEKSCIDGAGDMGMDKKQGASIISSFFQNLVPSSSKGQTQPSKVMDGSGDGVGVGGGGGDTNQYEEPLSPPIPPPTKEESTNSSQQTGRKSGGSSFNNGNYGRRYSVENDGGLELPLRILIPNEFIGAIIGRGGSTIRAISKGTGARVHIFRHSNRYFEMPEKPICITGPQESSTQACKKIIEIMAQEADHRRYGSGGYSALKICVPNSVVGRIIGKAGAVIKEIMEETQTKIHISNQPDFLEQNMGVMRSNRIVTVRGSIDGMVQAEKIISTKLHEAYNDGRVRDRDLEFGNIFPDHRLTHNFFNYYYNNY